ncbi:hypothetical protein BC567DRAFT_42412 [Phyllosticta citribraziliensis]
MARLLGLSAFIFGSICVLRPSFKFYSLSSPHSGFLVAEGFPSFYKSSRSVSLTFGAPSLVSTGQLGLQRPSGATRVTARLFSTKPQRPLVSLSPLKSLQAPRLIPERSSERGSPPFPRTFSSSCPLETSPYTIHYPASTGYKCPSRTDAENGT